jgi:hypothetical protein
VSQRRRLLLSSVLATGSAILAVLVLPVAAFGSDFWSNISPAAPLGQSGLFGHYPLDHYTLDRHFTVVSASLTGGVDVSGVAPMMAYFLAGVVWLLTSFLANVLITLFGFAFSLDLVNGSAATEGSGALAPVSAAIHSIYANVFGGPWLVLAISVVGIWAMWKALIQRRYSETAGTLGLSLIYVVVALFFVYQPAGTIGTASKWTNQMSEAFLSIADHGDPSGSGQAKNDIGDQLFNLLVFKPWVVLNFGGLEHCVVTGTGDDDSDPQSVAVRPLSQNPARDAALAHRLATGTEVTADGKICVNNANKYAPHFLRFGFETDERNAEYDALNDGDSSKLPDADTATAGYQLGVADKPASDAMEAGGQYQRLLLALVIFVGELGAFCLLGSLSVGIILAQVLLLLLLAFAPVALVAAPIPGRGHAFFKSWLEKLAGYLLRKAAYSLILATLLAVAGAISSVTSQLGWLMSFGLQALFFWTVFLQRKTLADSLIGIATGPRAPGRDNALRLLGLYAGARTLRRPIARLGRTARAGATAPIRGVRRVTSALGGKGATATPPGTAAPAPRFGTSYSAPVGGGVPSMGAPGPSERKMPETTAEKSSKKRAATASSAGSEVDDAGDRSGRKGADGSASRRQRRSATEAGGATATRGPGEASGGKPNPGPRASDPPAGGESPSQEPDLQSELREERQRAGQGAPTPKPAPGPTHPPPRRWRRWRRRKSR